MLWNQKSLLMKNKFILNFTPTGLIPTKEMTSHVPLLPEEIIKQALEIAELGANRVHLHAREVDTELPTYKHVFPSCISKEYKLIQKH